MRDQTNIPTLHPLLVRALRHLPVRLLEPKQRDTLSLVGDHLMRLEKAGLATVDLAAMAEQVVLAVLEGRQLPPMTAILIPVQIDPPTSTLVDRSPRR